MSTTGDKKSDTAAPSPSHLGQVTEDGRRIDLREERLFRSLDYDNDAAVRPRDFKNVLVEAGIAPDDHRIKQSMTALKAYVDRKRPPDEETEPKISPQAFCNAIRPNILLIERALQGRMVIPDFAGMCEELQRIYDATSANRQGAPADYIPQLNLPEPDVDRFGVAVCTIDGQRFSAGDAEHFFSVQSTTKPISYGLALEEHGPELVHRFVGLEPSGASFNELTLDKQNRPHNPLINAGAIMSSALIRLTDKQRLLAAEGAQSMDMRGWSGRRFEYVMDRWRALCGDEMPRFSTSIFLSERETSDRNHALAYYMRERDAFPDLVDMHDVLEFYTQCCSIELNAEMMSVVAATLANGGICPTTGERVFKTETVRNCLSLMSSCGMYDFAGEFAFAIGLPAKSGVSGAIMIVIPNVMGLCTWSPRLDELGNSVRGIEFCRRLVETFNFHNFDNLTGTSGKRDPRLNPIQAKAREVNEMIWAASKGDLGAIQDRQRRGTGLGCEDYDLRTPLHLAAAENQVHVVRYYIEQAAADPAAVNLNPRDRWGGTPMDDARRHGHERVARLLQDAGGRPGTTKDAAPGDTQPVDDTRIVESAMTDELIWAASLGDLSAIRRLVAQGVSLEIADYDRRTAIHLAAAEGRLEVVRFFTAHGVEVNPADRWGNTPLDEAIRHGREAVAKLLQANGARESRRTDRRARSGDDRKAA